MGGGWSTQKSIAVNKAGAKVNLAKGEETSGQELEGNSALHNKSKKDF